MRIVEGEARNQYIAGDNHKSKKVRYRRLTCEATIYSRGYDNFHEVAKACEIWSARYGEPITFNKLSIQHYIACVVDMSFRRMKILAELLGVRDLVAMDEKFKEPETLNVGLEWIGEYGTRVRDINMNDRYTTEVHKVR